MSGTALAVSSAPLGLGAIVDLGATQNNIERSFGLDPNATVVATGSANPPDQIGILGSGDNFVTDAVLVGIVTAGNLANLRGVYRYVRTIRLQINESAFPTATAYVNDMVPGANIGSSGVVANGGQSLGINWVVGPSDAFSLSLVANAVVGYLQTSAGSLTLGTATAGQTTTLQTGAAGTIAIGATGTTTINVGGPASAVTTLALAVAAGGTVNIASGAVAATVNVGTGAAAMTSTFGSQTTTSTTVINGGTNGVGIGVPAASVGFVQIVAGTGTSSWSIGAAGTLNIQSGVNAATVNIATVAAAQTVTVGSTNTTSTTAIQGGSGAANAVTLTATGTGGIVLASGTSASSAWTIGAGGTLSLANDANAHTVNLATGAAAQTVSIGSTNTTSSLTLRGGPGATGGIFLGSTSFSPVALLDNTAPTQAQIDGNSYFTVNNATSMITYASMKLLLAPTNTAAGKVIWIENIGTVAYLVGDATQKQGVNIPPGNTPGLNAASANKGQCAGFVWNGVAWCPMDSGLGTAVEGGALTDQAADAPVRVGRFTRYTHQAISQGITDTVGGTGALVGDVIRIVRTIQAGAFTITVNNSAGTIAVLPVSVRGYVDVIYLGGADSATPITATTGWVLLGCGTCT